MCILSDFPGVRKISGLREVSALCACADFGLRFVPPDGVHAEWRAFRLRRPLAGLLAHVVLGGLSGGGVVAEPLTFFCLLWGVGCTAARVALLVSSLRCGRLVEFL
jgi:hypothetical protein